MKDPGPSSNDYFDKLFTGNFQLAYGDLATPPGPTPYYELRNTLAQRDHGAHRPDCGRGLRALQELGGRHAASTSSAPPPTTTKQHDLIKQVEAVMLDDVPVIPVTEGVAWYQ